MESRETEAPIGPDDQPGHAERSDDDTTPQTGGGVEPSEQGGDDPQVGGITEGAGSHGSEQPGERIGQGEEGGHAHTAPGEGHPAGDGPRSGRDVGGPTADEGAEAQEGTEAGGRGDIQTKGFDSHQ